MKVKNNYNECITNFACSIRKYFELDYKHNTLPEIDNYIMREELLITIIGILVGLVLGTIYTYMLIDSIEINTMKYIKGIHLDSYLQTSAFMIIFTIIVSIGEHFTLKKIDLIESLKSVE